ncbi:MAG: hypothetical protein ACRERE_23480 [Candidatus Entotheonellia bacterium]
MQPNIGRPDDELSFRFGQPEAIMTCPFPREELDATSYSPSGRKIVEIDTVVKFREDKLAHGVESNQCLVDMVESELKVTNRGDLQTCGEHLQRGRTGTFHELRGVCFAQMADDRFRTGLPDDASRFSNQ